ncbi:MAG: thymidine phosphorylase [Chloroflexota bacterium]
MRAVDVIIKKRECLELTSEEITYFINGFTSGDIPDYQASALAMAILLNGMSPRETKDLTLAMARSGQMLDLSDVVDIAVDKHSSGGVGDKTTLVVLPVVAACGLSVGKMSGRGLGFSGGTLDKMESIPGYRSNLSIDEIKRQLGDIGIVLTGQSLDLAPADGKLYALRDVTGTVQSIPLIASSIMSKKIAAGAQAILLDVKTGLGAFMQNLVDARTLAHLMVDIGKLAGRQVIALLSDMNQPLGYAVGNSVEVREALDTLAGDGPEDFRHHCMHVIAHMLVLGQRAPDLAAARGLGERAIAEGRAMDKFRELVQAQGGDITYVDNPEKFPVAKLSRIIEAHRSGFISQVHARLIGEGAVKLGAGRARKGDPVDHAVGLMIHVKVGDPCERGQPLLTILSNDIDRQNEVEKHLGDAFAWSDDPVPPLPHFYQ